MENELIVVVPSITNYKPTDLAFGDVKYIGDCIDRVLLAGSHDIPSSQRADELVRVKKLYERVRDGKVVHEYTCRVKNYAERGDLA